jgi:hypothetical protein
MVEPPRVMVARAPRRGTWTHRRIGRRGPKDPCGGVAPAGSEREAHTMAGMRCSLWPCPAPTPASSSPARPRMPMTVERTTSKPRGGGDRSPRGGAREWRRRGGCRPKRSSLASALRSDPPGREDGAGSRFSSAAVAPVQPLDRRRDAFGHAGRMSPSSWLRITGPRALTPSSARDSESATGPPSAPSARGTSCPHAASAHARAAPPPSPRASGPAGSPRTRCRGWGR